jgi:glycine hydroxymethyltransferase
MSNLDTFFGDDLASSDTAIDTAVQRELTRQEEQIELIASENIVSKAVM